MEIVSLDLICFLRCQVVLGDVRLSRRRQHVGEGEFDEIHREVRRIFQSDADRRAVWRQM